MGALGNAAEDKVRTIEMQMYSTMGAAGKTIVEGIWALGNGAEDTVWMVKTQTFKYWLRELD